MIKYNDGVVEVGHALCAAKYAFTKPTIFAILNNKQCCHRESIPVKTP